LQFAMKALNSPVFTNHLKDENRYWHWYW